MTCDYPFPTCCVYIQCVSHPRFYQANISHRPSLYFFSLPAVVPTRLLTAHHSAAALGTYTGCGWSILYSGHVGMEDCTLETCELTCDYPFPTCCVYIQCISHPRFYQTNISHRPSLYFYSLPAVVPTRLLMAHHSAAALGTYTGCGWSILYSGHVGVEDRTLETV